MTCWRLALALGYRTPDRMLRDLNVDELDELLIYDLIQPIGTLRTDLEHANIMAALWTFFLRKPRSLWRHMLFDRKEPRENPVVDDKVASERLKGILPKQCLQSPSSPPSQP